MKRTEYNVEKMYTYVKGYIYGANFINSMNALGYARDKHEGQFRKDGVTPYFVHPLQMACYAIALGIRDDILLAIIILHDVCEDCQVDVKDLPVSDKVKEGVSYMTLEYIDGEDKLSAKLRYNNNLLKCHRALIAKGIDKYMNLKSMVGVFDDERIRKNVREAYDLLDILKKGKEKYSEYSEVLYVLRENIRGIADTLAIIYNVE